MAKPRTKEDPFAKARAEGFALATRHPLFEPLAQWGRFNAHGGNGVGGREALARITTQKEVELHPSKHASVEEWAWAVAHVYTHLGLGHRPSKDVVEDLANCAEVNTMLKNLQVGKPPSWVEASPSGPRSEVVRAIRAAKELPLLGANGREPDVLEVPVPRWGTSSASHEELFERGLRRAVSRAVMVASGEVESMTAPVPHNAPHVLALKWFASSYPLLGGLAADLTLVDDPDALLRERIDVAAVNPSRGELYLNPSVHLSLEEWKFVIAHEMLHVGLRHDVRRSGRDPEIWNVACDYSLNLWLLEMGVGTMPRGLLYDAELKGLSAEEVYDRIVKDSRHYRKLMTLRGVGIGDILGERDREHDEDDVVDLDSHYRRALSEGLEVHLREGRGLLPANLVEEIRALESPPPPWDVELAEWFEEMFPTPEPERTYSRLSRRQAASPDVIRPGKFKHDESVVTRTFAVVLDTSGSMDRALLGHALGAVASYAVEREVHWVRLVFCDAAAYDEGFVAPEDIAERVRVRGRGGTELTPGVKLVEAAEDFPADGPILVITDGFVEPDLRIKREHAYLIPRGASLPFKTHAPVFRFA